MSEPSTRPRVLIVDDDSDVREALTELLEHAGFAVAIAVNGREALARIRELRPDVVLLDGLMPEMDGAGCLDELRGDPRIASTRVVMISADRAAASEVTRADRVVTKPFSLDEILAAIDEVLRA